MIGLSDYWYNICLEQEDERDRPYTDIDDCVEEDLNFFDYE